eukprot:1196035-Prorocentrum_minimum.AAC.2
MIYDEHVVFLHTPLEARMLSSYRWQYCLEKSSTWMRAKPRGDGPPDPAGLLGVPCPVSLPLLSPSALTLFTLLYIYIYSLTHFRSTYITGPPSCPAQGLVPRALPFWPSTPGLGRGRAPPQGVEGPKVTKSDRQRERRSTRHATTCYDMRG